MTGVQTCALPIFKDILITSLKETWGFCVRKESLKNVYLKAILKSIFDFLKKFRKPKQKTSTTIFIHEIHVDKIEANVNLRKLK